MAHLIMQVIRRTIFIGGLVSYFFFIIVLNKPNKFTVFENVEDGEYEDEDESDISKESNNKYEVEDNSIVSLGGMIFFLILKYSFY
jgi:hypothetical protein